MPGHSDPCQIHSVRERTALVPGFELIEDRTNVAHAQEKILERRSFAQRLHSLRWRRIFPHEFVAAGMLHKHREVATRRPPFAEKFAALTRSTQSVAEQNHGRRLAVRRKINANRNIAIPRSIMHSQ